MGCAVRFGSDGKVTRLRFHPPARRPPGIHKGTDMSPTTLIIGGALELAIICVSLYGAVTLPPGAQIPVHGAAGYNRWLPKSIGLAFWPVFGVVVYVIVLATQHSQQVHGSPAVGLTIALCVMLVAQIGALARARSGSNGGRGAGDGQ
jgi:hypothetical protein